MLFRSGAWGRTLATQTEGVFQPEGFQTSGVGSRASVPSSFSHLPTPASSTSSPRYPSDGSIISRKTCEGRPVHFSLKPTTQQLAGRMFPGAVDPGRVDGVVTVEEVGQGLPPVAAVGLTHPTPPPLFSPPPYKEDGGSPYDLDAHFPGETGSRSAKVSLDVWENHGSGVNIIYNNKIINKLNKSPRSRNTHKGQESLEEEMETAGGEGRPMLRQEAGRRQETWTDRKSTRLNSSHSSVSRMPSSA